MAFDPPLAVLEANPGSPDNPYIVPDDHELDRWEALYAEYRKTQNVHPMYIGAVMGLTAEYESFFRWTEFGVPERVAHALVSALVAWELPPVEFTDNYTAVLHNELISAVQRIIGVNLLDQKY